MRRLGLIPIMLALLLPTAVLADPGNGKGAGQDNGNGGTQSQSNNGGQGNGQNNGNGPGNNGNGKGNGGSNGRVDVPTTGPAASDQTVARDALETGSTLPLATIARAAIQAGGGRLIEAQLFIINKMPVYRLTLVDNRGVTRRVYYDARTAKPVGPP